METNLTRLLIERCAKALEEAVVPKVSENYAVQQTMAAIQVLRILAPNVRDRIRRPMAENQKMRQVLNQVRTDLRKSNEEAPSEILGIRSLINTIDNALAEDDTSSAALAAANHALKELLIKTIKGLDAVSEAVPVQRMASMREEIRGAIRQQLDHESERLGNRTLTGDFLSDDGKAA